MGIHSPAFNMEEERVAWGLVLLNRKQGFAERSPTAESQLPYPWPGLSVFLLVGVAKRSQNTAS